MHRQITKVEPKENCIIVATFTDGEVVEYDFKKLFDRFPVFKNLMDKELFNSVKVDGVGYGISWNDDIDFSSDSIYECGKHIR